MAISFWLIMMIGFSDNWLYDTSQPSNSNPIFIIHGLIAFAWYSLLPIQTALIGRKNIGLHRKLGLISFIIFILLIPASLAIYLDLYLRTGSIDGNAMGLLLLYLFGVGLIIHAYRLRKKDLKEHKMLMIFGSFLLLRPAVDRVINKLIDVLPPAAIYASYLLIFLLFYYLFYRHKGKLSWYISTAFVIWFLGVIFGYMI